MKAYWEPEKETMSKDALVALQNRRLERQLEAVYKNVLPYKEKMVKSGVEPGDIKGIEDLHKLPFTVKTDLRDNYPYGLFATPMRDVVRIHASSGTTGKQTVVGYTQDDIAIWNECMARSLTMTGATKDDVVHVSYGYGLFTGGLGGHYGGEAIGAATVPASVGNTKRQLQMFEDFGSTVLLCTPSYAMYLGEMVENAGIKEKLKLRIGVHGAEPWTEGLREQIEQALGLICYDIFGLSEICGPGVSCECQARDGLHVQEDHFYPEIIDPVTGEPQPDNVPGELVFTCLTKQALPLIRYNTRDITTLTHQPCSCGRTMVRMGKITGRTDDMLIIRGVNVFPSQIESVLMEIPEASPNYFITVDRENNLDTLEVQVELREFSDEIRLMSHLEERITHEILSILGISVKVILTAPGTIARSEGKAKRVQDNRK
ncbi:MAG: phenylacetate--CoA ligase [Oscillospiraceae bacterium]|nr:phenylacetate--CoA ligase [Oscillospiraceae bacterium]